jgi:tRNA(fMet)-specific endonuclease VapC
MCIYLLNGHPHVKTRVVEVGITALALAIPTVGELYFGAYNSGRVEANVARVRAFLSPVLRKNWISLFFRLLSELS